MKADIIEVRDGNEQPSMMEPLLISEASRHRENLTDLMLDLTKSSSRLIGSLPIRIHTALADLVRSMNCYYSNLIEGHDTHPIDIERALNNDFSANPVQRNLQLEATAHIAIHKWIDQGKLPNRVTMQESICEIHKRFGELLPNDLLQVENPSTGEHMKVIPGELRKRDVQVGRHTPISPGALPRFLKRFEDVYTRLGTAETIIAAAAAHHRLLWIHPFLDGNGRVARLMSHAMLLEVLDTGGIWSIARGLARNETTYKAHLEACDLQRKNDLDGRGNLGEENLAAFTHFFLETCLDQVKFMEGLVEPNHLHARILMWAEEKTRTKSIPPKASSILEAILYRGELPRSEIAGIVGSGDRHARRVVAALTKRGVLVSESSRAPLQLAFPAKLAQRWMPGLFPEKKI